MGSPGQGPRPVGSPLGTLRLCLAHGDGGVGVAAGGGEDGVGGLGH